MLNLKVSATYYTNMSSGKHRTHVDFKKSIPECPDNFLYSVVKKRYLPLWVEEARKKNKDKYPNFDGVENVRIYDYECDGKPCGIIGKDLMELDEKGLQDLATRFCLIAAPLPLLTDIKTAREKNAIIYLEQVKGFNFSTDKEKSKYAVWQKTPLGYKFDAGQEKFIIEDKQIGIDDDDEIVVKQSLSDMLGIAPTEEDLLKA